MTRSRRTTWRPLRLELMGHGDKEPVSQCVPHSWRFGTAKQLMLEAGELISAEDATRRVLVLENPAMHGKSQTTNTLFAGIQMILPGEIAPPHRHVACALRFVLDGKGAYTNVGGEKAVMNCGDLIVTPSWTAHEHGNQSDQPMLWLDVLDLPTVRFFEAGFFERVGSGRRTNDQARSNASARPHPSPLQDSQKPLKYSPVVNYRYAEMRPRLEQRSRPAISTGDTARSCVTPILATAAGSRPPWRHSLRCCRGDLSAQRTVDLTAWCLFASRAAAPPGSRSARWNGRRVMCSSFRPGRIGPTTRSRRACCSPFRIAPRRKRSASGARTEPVEASSPDAPLLRPADRRSSSSCATFPTRLRAASARTCSRGTRSWNCFWLRAGSPSHFPARSRSTYRTTRRPSRRRCCRRGTAGADTSNSRLCGSGRTAPLSCTSLSTLHAPNQVRFLAEGLAVHLEETIGNIDAYPTLERRPRRGSAATDARSGTRCNWKPSIRFRSEWAVARRQRRARNRNPRSYRARRLFVSGLRHVVKFLAAAYGLRKLKLLYDQTPLTPGECRPSDPQRYAAVFGKMLPALQSEWLEWLEASR